MRALAPIFALVLPLVVGTANAVELKTDQDKLSYSIGVDLGTNFKKQAIPVNQDALFSGFKDAQAGAKLQLSDDQMHAVLRQFQENLIQKKANEFKQQAEKNQNEGNAFLANNKTKKDVVTLPSGLQYKVINAGAGKNPNANSTVTVEYTGKLLNGTVFDSTEKTKKPVSFPVNKVIPGWTQALQMMKPGATWEVYIPANLAYGERGVAGVIGPNQTLVFQIHLISIQ